VEAITTQEARKKIIEYCASKKQIIDKKSVELLENEKHWKQILDKITDTIVSSNLVKDNLLRHESKLGNIQIETIVKKTTFKSSAKEEEPDFRVMKELDVTNQSSSEGKINDFLNYFTDKYNFLSTLLTNRVGFNPKPLDKLSNIQKYQELDIIGMVMRKWVSKKGNTTLEMDSPEGRCIVIVSKEDASLNRVSDKILLDDVIGVTGKKFADEVIIAKSFLWPDLMQRQPKIGERDLSVMLISDTHIGSKLFMEKEFGKFLSWINGNTTSPKELERIGKIKYLIIAGDNVDGVGIYPEQYNELSIKDIYQQYEKFEEFIKQIPEYIEIFICPGQHDAVLCKNQSFKIISTASSNRLNIIN